MLSSLFARDYTTVQSRYVFYYRGIRSGNSEYPFSLEITPSQLIFYLTGPIGKPSDFFNIEQEDANEEKIKEHNFLSYPILVLPTFHSSLEGRNSETEIISIYNDVLTVDAISLEDNRHFSTFSMVDESSVLFTEVEKNKIFLRQLLLDFLFELRHEDTFHDNLPPALYASLVQWVESYFVLKAILCKYEYYYHRQSIESSDTKGELSKIKLGTTEVQLFIEAECEWAKMITTMNAANLFYNTEWFDDVEVELKKLYSIDPEKRKKCFDKAVASSMPKYSKGKISINVGIDKLLYLRNKSDSVFLESMQWLTVRYGHGNALDILSLQTKNNAWLNAPKWIRIIALILFVSSILHTNSDCYLYRLSYIFWTVFALTVIIGFIPLFYPRYQRNKFRTLFSVLNIRFFLSIATFWLIISSSKDTWEMVFRMDEPHFWWLLISSAVATIILFRFDVNLKTFPQKSWGNHLFAIEPWKRCITTFLQGLFYSLLFGTVIQIFLAERVLESSEIREEMKEILGKPEMPNILILEKYYDHQIDSLPALTSRIGKDKFMVEADCYYFPSFLLLGSCLCVLFSTIAFVLFDRQKETR